MGILEKKTESIIVHWDSMGTIEKIMNTIILVYLGYIGVIPWEDAHTVLQLRVIPVRRLDNQS